jgi:hypothetical protein
VCVGRSHTYSRNATARTTANVGRLRYASRMRHAWYLAALAILVAACSAEIVIPAADDEPVDNPPVDPTVTSSGVGSSSSSSSGNGGGGTGGSGGAATGQCDAATPTELAADIRLHIALEGSHVYYTSNHLSLNRVHVCGGPPQTLANLQGSGYGLTITGGYVFVAMQNGPASVMRVPINGGTAEPWSTSEPKQAEVIVTDGDSLFWTEWNELKTMSVAGGTVTQLATGVTAHAVAVDDAHVYYYTTNELRRIPKSGGVSQVVAPNPGSWSGRNIHIDNSGIYFTDFDSHAILRVPAFGAPASLITDHPNLVHAMQLTSDYIYVADAAADLVRRYDKNGTNPVIIANSPEAPAAVQVDATSIYWTTYDNQRLWKLDL